MKAKFALAAFLLITTAILHAQEWAREAVNRSPRHHEWVEVKHGDRVVHAFVAYPEVREKANVVILIHENRGLTDWEQSVADQLAATGYIAIAGDFLSGTGPGGGRTKDFADANAAREGIGKLPPEQVTADLDALVAYAKKIPAASGKVAVGGFCWGGAQTFRFAATGAGIGAAFVFYGTGPQEVDGVHTPVYGFYGENDARVNATIPKSEEAMKAAGKKFEPVIYAGAGHGFMRSGQAPDASDANRKARDDAWKRWLALLAAM